jgi:thiol:disulfide interchange protein DsbC
MRGVVAYILMAVACGISHQSAAAESAEASQLKAVLSVRLKGEEILEVSRSPMPGVFEVVTRSGVAYTDVKGDFLLTGQLYDMLHNQKDLTTERMETRNSIKFEDLPFDKAIKVVRGNGTRTFAIFSDPDCPYCRQLEKELAGLTDVTIYVFLYPISGIHPGASLKARAIWCSADRAAAWEDWMLRDKLPERIGCSEDPVDDLKQLATTLNIQSTPTSFLSSGRRVLGVRARAELDALLASP